MQSPRPRKSEAADEGGPARYRYADSNGADQRQLYSAECRFLIVPPQSNKPLGSTLPGLVLTDEVLFDNRHSPAARLVLAATLAHRDKSPSVDFLVEALGLMKDTVIAAQRELEETVGVWFGHPDGTFEHIATYSTASFDRPSLWFERQKSDPRFARSTRLDSTARWADPAKNPKIELPRTILARLPKRGRNNALIRLVTLTYAREQLRRGAIQIEDNALGYLLAVKPRQVQRARESLIEEGILVLSRPDNPCDVYTMPEGTPGREPNPDALDPTRTRRLATFRIHTFDFRAFASENQLAEIGRHVARLGDIHALAALAVGIPTSLAEVLDGVEILNVLAALPTEICRSKELPLSFKGTRSVVQRNGRATSHRPPQKTSANDNPPASEEPPEDVSGEGEKVPGLPRHEWNGEWPSLFYFATHRDHEEITRLLFAFKEKHGHAEAVHELRKVCRECAGSGKIVLARLRELAGHLVTSDEAEDLADVIDLATIYDDLD